jgi:hypothetical protein
MQKPNANQNTRNNSSELYFMNETQKSFNVSVMSKSMRILQDEEKMRLDGITEKYNMIFDQWMKKAKGKLDNQVQST